MHTATTDSLMNPFSPSAVTTATTIPRGPPGVVTYRYQHEGRSEMAYVTLAQSHEEAQVAATNALASLAGIDPRWLAFTITIRYRRSNERQDIVIAPNAWSYVTSRLVPGRVIDVHVIPTSPPPPPPPSLPPSPGKSTVPPYPDSPPPLYPGTTQKHAPLPPVKEEYGYGYGYGLDWQHHAIGADSSGTGPQLDPREMADRRSMGWSASSVKFVQPRRRGTGLFGRFRQKGFGIFPITWDDDRPLQRGNGTMRWRRERGERELQMLHDQQQHPSPSGHSYVPSLI